MNEWMSVSFEAVILVISFRKAEAGGQSKWAPFTISHREEWRINRPPICPFYCRRQAAKIMKETLAYLFLKAQTEEEAQGRIYQIWIISSFLHSTNILSMYSVPDIEIVIMNKKTWCQPLRSLQSRVNRYKWESLHKYNLINCSKYFFFPNTVFMVLRKYLTGALTWPWGSGKDFYLS